MLASFIRKRLSSRRKLGAIDLPYATSPERRVRLQRPGESSFSVGISGKFRMTPPSHTILRRIAHILPQACRFASVRIFRDVPSVTAEVEQFRPAILYQRGDHDGGDEHFFSLFQVL